MPNVQARIMSQQIFTYAQQTSVSGGMCQRIGYGVTDGVGASGGTTIDDSTGIISSGSADDYNGRYWIEILDGDARKEWKRVVDDDGAGILTLENNGFSAQIASGVRYALWLLPEAEVIVVEGSADETHIEDTVRAEADDYWNGYYVTVIKADSAGQQDKIVKVTDFANATGIFTVAAMGAALTAGDVCILSRSVEVGNFAPGFSREFHERFSNRTNWSRGDGVIGAKGMGPLSFECQITPSGTVPEDGDLAVRSVLHGLFQAAGLVEALGETTTIDDGGAAGSTTSLLIDTATHENFDIGQMVIWKGNAAFITSKTDGGGTADTLVVAPPFPSEPLDGDAIIGTSMYRKILTGDFNGVNIVWEIDGVRHKFFTCKGNIEVVDAPIPLLRFTLSYDHYIREPEEHVAKDELGATYETTPPVLGKDKEVFLDATQIDVAGLTATPGVEVVARNVSGRYGVNGRAGTQLINQRGGGTYQRLLESDGVLDDEELFNQRTASYFKSVWGSHGETFAVTMPVMLIVAEPHPADFEGMMAAPGEMEAQDAGTFDDPTDGVVKIPDIALHIT